MHFTACWVSLLFTFFLHKDKAKLLEIQIKGVLVVVFVIIKSPGLALNFISLGMGMTQVNSHTHLN